MAVGEDLDRWGLPVARWTEFEQLLPGIEGRARHAFHRSGPRRAEVLVAEVTAHAFKIFVMLAQRGKVDIAYARPLAAAAVQRVRTTRRLPGIRRFHAFIESTWEINHGRTNP